MILPPPVMTSTWLPSLPSSPPQSRTSSRPLAGSPPSPPPPSSSTWLAASENTVEKMEVLAFPNNCHRFQSASVSPLLSHRYPVLHFDIYVLQNRFFSRDPLPLLTLLPPLLATLCLWNCLFSPSLPRRSPSLLHAVERRGRQLLSLASVVYSLKIIMQQH